MKSNQKLLIMFWLRKSKATKDGLAPLYARVTIDGTDENISISQKADPKFWDTDLKRITDPSSEGRKINLKIAEAEINLDKHFTVLQTQHETVTALMLKKAYTRAEGNLKNDGIQPGKNIANKTVLEVFADFITRFEKQVKAKKRSGETLRHWKTTRTKVEKFIQFQYQIIDIDLIDIKFAFAQKFYDYMTLEVDKPIAEITAKGYIKKVKQLLKECVTNEFIPRNPIYEFCCAGGEKDVEPLEMYEVQAIIEKEISLPRLSEVRDAFVFQIFTGFAFQDVYALNSENIRKVGNKGERWLIKDRGKTEVTEMVPILPNVDQLIERYTVHPYCIASNCLIPVNSNQRYNSYLKELATLCGIKRELNTHLARHTFADIMLNSGVPIEDVSKMLGHKSLRTTQRYCKVRKNRISQSMAIAKMVLFESDGKLKAVC